MRYSTKAEDVRALIFSKICLNSLLGVKETPRIFVAVSRDFRWIIWLSLEPYGV
jgi:hypothetical protein